MSSQGTVMIDFSLDEPLALLAEAFGQEPDGADLIRIDGEASPSMTMPGAAIIAVTAAAPAEAGAYTTRLD